MPPNPLNADILNCQSYRENVAHNESKWFLKCYGEI